MQNKTLLKVCGIRSISEMEEIKDLDFEYVGCIFAQSQRRVTTKIAKEIVKIAHKNGKKVVGVFVNAMIRDIVRIVEILNLDVVQLHGKETVEYCEELNKSFNRMYNNKLDDIQNEEDKIKIEKTKIWKTFTIVDKLPNISDYIPFIEYPLFEAKGEKAGGNGITFNWKILKDVEPYSYILAGGISTKNIEIALYYKPAIVDINSKVEKNDRKDRELIKKVINIINVKG